MAISSNQNGGVFADINITPLTDIFLVLLIIFMVATAITIESAAHVDLPKVQAPATTEKPRGVAVMYTADHRIFVNQGEVTEQNLPAALKDAIARDPDKLVVFQGDPSVILADMVHILDIAKTAGAQQIAIAVAKFGGSAVEPGGAGVPSGPVTPPEPGPEGP
ncbi:MAG TPA: biopolymer transporter ExbD [Xanthobacteraceae bacterium]|nr:biopolymer transporter ExbD [Xanthobacteraceae bacterium]